MFSNATLFLEKTVSILWGPATVILFLAVGFYFFVGTNFVQLFCVRQWLFRPLKTLLGKHTKNKGALCTVLGATAGTGNIVGVAAALGVGGAGAVFWMWVSAFFGMSLGFAENLLGVLYRKQNKNGKYIGGASLYIQKGLKSKKLATLYNISCALAAFGVGNLTQGNSLAGGIAAVAQDMNVGFSNKTALLVGVIVAALACPVIIGGKDSISKIAERIVPFAVVLFLVFSIILIGINAKNIIPSIKLIFKDAFCFSSAAGGVAGVLVSSAIRTGLSRGLFSHEAGMGTSVGVHSAQCDTPLQAGFLSMFEVFADTIVICTLTALVILTSGVFTKTQNMDAPLLVSAAFSQMLGKMGGAFVAVMLFVFAFSTILGWGCFGQEALKSVSKKAVLPYKLVYIAAIPFGCVVQMKFCWYLSDVLNWVMAILNVFAITLLSKEVFKERKIKNYGTKKGGGNT